MTAVKYCPNGHQMDPSWNVCPYCRTDAPEVASPAAMAATMREVAPGVAEQPTPPPPRKTMRISQIKVPVVGWLVDTNGRQKGEDFRIEEGKVLLGAAPDCQIRLENDFASEQHASLRYHEGEYILTDLDSTNGTYVNDQPISRVVLADGDRIKIGETTYIFKGLYLGKGSE
jgi:hypothetical protein